MRGKLKNKTFGNSELSERLFSPVQNKAQDTQRQVDSTI